MRKNKVLCLLLAFILIVSVSGMAFAHPGHEGGHDPEEITTSDVAEATSSSSSSPSSSSSDYQYTSSDDSSAASDDVAPSSEDKNLTNKTAENVTNETNATVEVEDSGIDAGLIAAILIVVFLAAIILYNRYK